MSLAHGSKSRTSGGDAPAGIPVWPQMLPHLGCSVCFFWICPSQAVWWMCLWTPSPYHSSRHPFVLWPCLVWAVILVRNISLALRRKPCLSVLTRVHLFEGGWLPYAEGRGLKVPPGPWVSLSTHWKFPETRCLSESIKLSGIYMAWDIFVSNKEKRADLEAFAWSASTKCAWNHHRQGRQNIDSLKKIK